MDLESEINDDDDDNVRERHMIIVRGPNLKVAFPHL